MSPTCWLLLPPPLLLRRPLIFPVDRVDLDDDRGALRRPVLPLVPRYDMALLLLVVRPRMPPWIIRIVG